MKYVAHGIYGVCILYSCVRAVRVPEERLAFIGLALGLATVAGVMEATS